MATAAERPCGPSASDPEPVPIRCVELRRSFRSGDQEIHAVDGIDFSARTGELVAVMGPSGSGKSTFLHLLGGVDRPDSGQVFLEGRDISTVSDRELGFIRRRRMGFLLQFFSLLPTLTALENVALPLLLDGVRTAQASALEALEWMGLKDRAAHPPARLSGGEQQRVALARALVTRPAVIFADEPTGNLDSSASSEILARLRDVTRTGQTIVLVTHDPSIVTYADRVVELLDGRVRAGSDAERQGEALPPTVTRPAA